MAFRTTGYWKTMLNRAGGGGGGGGGRTNFATSTSPTYGKVKGDFVPVCVAAGMVALAASMGLYTALHQLKHSPNVQVKKSRRETIMEVEDPDRVVEEGDKFFKKSFFRKVAHIQEAGDPSCPTGLHGQKQKH